MECSLCALMSFLLGCVYSTFSCALEYPFVVFLVSCLITVVLVLNIHCAKQICELTGGRACGTSGCAPGVNVECERPTCNAANSFDYGVERGPHTWCCPESNQSPINIIEDCANRFPIRELLTWNHYDDLPSGVMLENNGHTVILRGCYTGNKPTISGADLLASYTFVELNFRWSAFNTDGSEHMFNYRKFPMELQVMHRTGPSSSCTSSYDLLMVAYFFEISSHNPYLEPLVQHLHRIKRPGTIIEIPPFPLAYLCHQFRTNFYSYGGSLTEPPCYQGAEWFLFPEPLAISERQLNEFRQLISIDGKTRIMRNSRPVQNVSHTRLINLNLYNPLEVVCAEVEPNDCEDMCDDDECCE